MYCWTSPVATSEYPVRFTPPFQYADYTTSTGLSLYKQGIVKAETVGYLKNFLPLVFFPLFFNFKISSPPPALLPQLCCTPFLPEAVFPLSLGFLINPSPIASCNNHAINTVLSCSHRSPLAHINSPVLISNPWCLLPLD